MRKICASLKKQRPQDKHFIHQVRELAVLLDDPIAKKVGLDVRTGISRTFGQHPAFTPRGDIVDVYEARSNALGETTEHSISRMTKGRLSSCDATIAVWNPLIRDVDENTPIKSAYVFDTSQRSGLLIPSNSVGFLKQIIFHIGEDYILSTIGDDGTHAVVNLIEDPNYLNAKRTRGFVCDVIALLRLGYEIDESVTNEKISGMAVILKALIDKAENNIEMLKGLIAKRAPQFLDG